MKNISAVEFRFFSQAMAYPDDNFIKALKELKKREAKNLQYINNLIESAEEEKLTELQAEYTRLFISGFPKTPCPPYESFFTEGRLMGSANSSVQKKYSEWNLNVEPALSDNISAEFEFLAYLTAIAESKKDNQFAKDEYEQFYKEHIKKWVPKFAQKLLNNSKVKFYKIYADILLSKIV